LEAADNDGDPTNEFQDLTLAGNTLALTDDASTVDLSGYLDNTDNQDLTLAANTLALSGDASTVDLSGYLDNTDSQDLSLAANTLALTGDATTVDLSGYLDNTDSQDLDDVLSQGNDAGGSAITNAADPANPQDVATKSYVDNISISSSNIANDAVTAPKILNGTILNEDISGTAGIAAGKLQNNVMVESENVSLLNNDAGYITTVTSADITDGTIVNADVSGIAAIDGSKINPDFGSQNIQTTGSFNSGSATVSSLTVTDLAGANDTYTGDGAVNSFTISGGGVFSSSDVRLKTNIKDIPQALDKISKVEGKSYTFKSDHKEQIHFGVIAQDLMKLFPHLVRQNEDGYLSVNYLELIPVLIEALKEQQSTIQKLTIAMQREQELNYEIKVGLDKQRQLVRVQQFILTQLQMDKAAMENDIREIRQSLGLEAKKK